MGTPDMTDEEKLEAKRAKQRIRSAKFRAAHPERVAGHKKRWNEANRERCAEHAKGWRERNPAQSIALAAAYRKANPEKHKASVRKWQKANPAKVAEMDAASRRRRAASIKAYARARHKENPLLAAAAKAARRARKRLIGGKHTAADLAAIYAAQKGKCAYCKVSIKTGRHADHIVPLALGGTNDKTNIQMLCAPCNLSKGAKHPIDFAQARGLLL